MEEWRISTLGQLEALLGSNSGTYAIKDGRWRQRLAARCRIVREWISAWRRGRGKPVDRTALEVSGLVSGAFIDRIAELAASLKGDGAALIKALQSGQVPRFRASTVRSLEQWLKSQGYIDTENPLNQEERERQTLLEAGDCASPEEIRQVVHWLEGGIKSG